MMSDDLPFINTTSTCSSTTHNESSNNDKATSIWNFLQDKTTVSDDDYEEIMQARLKARLQAYGVGYEWILEPNKVDMEWPPTAVQTRYGGNYFWYGEDYLFRDFVRTLKEEATPEVMEVEEDNYLERVTHNVFGESESQQPSTKDVSPEEGIYDIIFYAAEYTYLLRHHRTTRGSLTLSYDKNNRLQGEIKMDDIVQNDLDIVPYGGDFTFVETNRFQRVVTPKHEDRRSHSVHETPTSCGVIQIQVSQAPNGTLEMRFGRVTPNVFKGEFKQLKQRIALRQQQDCPMPWGGGNDNDEVEPPLRTTPQDRHYNQRAVEECIQQNRRHLEHGLLWMRNHCHHLPTLPTEVLSRIQEFLSPPPYLILEENDWVLGVVWSGGLPSYSANSCLVVRKRV